MAGPSFKKRLVCDCGNTRFRLHDDDRLVCQECGLLWRRAMVWIPYIDWHKRLKNGLPGWTEYQLQTEADRDRQGPKHSPES